MSLILPGGYKNAGVNLLIVRNSNEIWVSMKDIHNGLGVKNMPDLVLKEIHGRYEKKDLTHEQITKYETTEREIFEKYDNLTKNKLNTKSNRDVYIKNDIMTLIIKRCRGGEKKEVKEK